MILLFPVFPLHREVDPSFQQEWDAAKAAGLECDLIDVENNGSVNDLRRAPKGPALYRGWMLDANGYGKFFNTMQAHGTDLFIKPKEYSHAHLLPRHYAKIAGHTPPSIWTGVDNATSDEWFEKVKKEFGDNPIVIKGFWKSAKHKWDEACFVSDASHRPTVELTIRKFLKEVESPGGIVFRKYMHLEWLEGGCPHGGDGYPPLCTEYRAFFFNGELLIWGTYWEEKVVKRADAYYNAKVEPPLDVMTELAQKVESPFFTMDVAKLVDGGWTVIELGDGGVSGLQGIKPSDFYQALAQALRK